MVHPCDATYIGAVVVIEFELEVNPGAHGKEARERRQAHEDRSLQIKIISKQQISFRNPLFPQPISFHNLWY